MTEHEKQEKRAKVIKGLEACSMAGTKDDCIGYGCPYLIYNDEVSYDCQEQMFDDALALLKAQEPRLVEPNDFENADDYNWLPAWCEERTGAGYWEMILPDALDEKDVRYWTGRPTDEQRAKEPWNGQA